MNEEVKEIRNMYKKERERLNYSIMDIGDILKNLAKSGVIWTLKDMPDISEPEVIIISAYINEYRDSQVYDNPKVPLFSITPTKPSQVITSQNETVQKNKQLKPLPVRDVELFNGYIKAKELEMKIIKISEGFPSNERKNIIDQILRSSSSIKESVRRGEQVFIRVKFKEYSVAIGSAKETSAWLHMSHELGYMSELEYRGLDKLTNEVVSILIGTLKNLRDNEGANLDLPDPFTQDLKRYLTYQNAVKIVKDIYIITENGKFSKEENLVMRLRKSATSCAANIAESNQLYLGIKNTFYNQAGQALDALISYLETAEMRGIIKKVEIRELEELMIGVKKMLSAQIKNLREKKKVV